MSTRTLEFLLLLSGEASKGVGRGRQKDENVVPLHGDDEK